MHDKIKELVKQAGGHISMRNLASNPVQHRESVELWDDNIEKFAKLLIKETLLIAKVGIEYGPSMEQVVHKYFGVDQ